MILDGVEANKIALHLVKLESGIIAKHLNTKDLIPIAEKLREIDGLGL